MPRHHYSEYSASSSSYSLPSCSSTSSSSDEDDVIDESPPSSLYKNPHYNTRQSKKWQTIENIKYQTRSHSNAVNTFLRYDEEEKEDEQPIPFFKSEEEKSLKIKKSEKIKHSNKPKPKTNGVRRYRKAGDESNEINLYSLTTQQLRRMLLSIDQTYMKTDLLPIFNRVPDEPKGDLLEICKFLLKEFGLEYLRFNRYYESIEKLEEAFVCSIYQKLLPLSIKFKYFTRSSYRKQSHKGILLRSHILHQLAEFMEQRDKLLSSAVCRDFYICMRNPRLWRHLDLSCIRREAAVSRSGRTICKSLDCLYEQTVGIFEQPVYRDIVSLDLTGLPLYRDSFLMMVSRVCNNIEKITAYRCEPEWYWELSLRMHRRQAKQIFPKIKEIITSKGGVLTFEDIQIKKKKLKN